jgi:DNA-binding CsgD family transcriptional regulator
VYVIDPTFVYGGSEGRFASAYSLTGAEMRVARLIADGLTGRQAATELGVSYNTVKTHLRNIYEKTGAAGQRGLIRRMLMPSAASESSAATLSTGGGID